MKTVNVPGSGSAVRVTEYGRFRGVDLSADAATIDPSRSPRAVNMISDNGGYPEKRPGWRALFSLPGRINGIFFAELSGEEHMLVHAGENIYRWEGSEAALLYEGAGDSPSSAFCAAGCLWILTGSRYLRYDGSAVERAAQSAYAPTTVISRTPDGGGVAFEAVNLLTGRRKNSFAGDGSKKAYRLDSTGIESVDKVSVNGAAVTAFTVNLSAGTVTFNTAPSAPGVAGQDNVLIEFTKNTEGYAETIEKCTVCGMFGLGGSDSERVFFSGNPDRPNVDWHSETHAPDYLTDPAYIPDTSFAHVGSDGSAVMGYRRMGDSQLVIKQESDHDATLFLRRGGQDSAGRPVFPITQGAAGVGAVSPRAFANIGDEPLFFSASGVYGISTDGISSEKKLQNRSFFIDRALCAESGLENAAAVEWEGRYVLALNGRCYVLDGRQGRSHRAQSGGDYVYECYLWENVPASALAENGSGLYFGTESGAVCKFNTDIPGVDRYNDDGAPISAVWTTKEDDDGDFGRHKNLSQRWLSVFLKPYARSSARVFLRTEKVPVKPAGETTVDIFDFAELRFDRLPFNTSSQPQVFPVRAKVKRYETLQISVENSEVNEGFGVLGIIKRFTVGGRVK